MTQTKTCPILIAFLRYGEYLGGSGCLSGPRVGQQGLVAAGRVVFLGVPQAAAAFLAAGLGRFAEAQPLPASAHAVGCQHGSETTVPL